MSNCDAERKTSFWTLNKEHFVRVQFVGALMMMINLGIREWIFVLHQNLDSQTFLTVQQETQAFLYQPNTGLGNRSKVETIFQEIVFPRSFKDGLRIQGVMEANLLMLDNCLILLVLRIQTGQAGQNISSINLDKIDT